MLQVAENVDFSAPMTFLRGTVVSMVLQFPPPPLGAAVMILAARRGQASWRQSRSLAGGGEEEADLKQRVAGDAIAEQRHAIFARGHSREAKSTAWIYGRVY